MNTPSLSWNTSKWPTRLVWTGLFLCFLSFKLLIINKFGNSTPFWDQWNGEGQLIFIPYKTGNITLAGLFSAHNEHRIVFTRLLSIGLLAINGTWDSKLEMVFQAMLHSLTLVLLVRYCTRIIRTDLRPYLIIFAAILFIIPVSWENTLWGFQSQFYFATLWGLLGIYMCWQHPTGSLKWSLGLICLVFGLFSMASGVLAAAIATVIALIRLYTNPKELKRESLGLGLLIIIVILGLITVHHVPAHDNLRAANMIDAGHDILKMMAWPIGFLGAAFLLQAPLIVMSVNTVKSRLGIGNPAWLLIAFGMWAWLQMAAIAYGRGSSCLASRYTDIFTFSIFINFAAIIYLLGSFSHIHRIWKPVFLGSWGFAVSLGVLQETLDRLPSQLEIKRDTSKTEENNVKGFLKTKNSNWLENKSLLDIPFPDPKLLEVLLSNPTLSAILPTDLQQGINPSSIDKTGQAFQQDGRYPSVPSRPFESIWGSYNNIMGDQSEGQLTLHYPAINNGAWLKISVTGYPNSSNMALTLTSASGKIQNIAPKNNPKETWTSIFIKSPNEPFTIVATDKNPNTWMAITLPRVIGLGTLLIGILQAKTNIIATLGLLLLVGGLIYMRINYSQKIVL